MDKISQENLDRILKLEPAALTDGDFAFLKARSSYLTADQVKMYFPESAPESVDGEQATAKRGKK